MTLYAVEVKRYARHIGRSCYRRWERVSPPMAPDAATARLAYMEANGGGLAYAESRIRPVG